MPRTPPSGAALATVSLFNRDPNRRAADPTGLLTSLYQPMPLPNNFRTGDGLNTAGYTWQRRSTDDFDVLNVKADHIFRTHHRAAYTYNAEQEAEYNTRYEQTFPDSPGGTLTRRDRLHTFSLVSTVRPTVLNEFRFGALRPNTRGRAPWEIAEHAGFLPRAGNQPYIPVFNLVSDVVVSDDDPVLLKSPLYQFTDAVTVIRGKHAFKLGGDLRLSTTDSFNSSDVMPRVHLGTGAVPVTGLDSIAGIGQNLANATSMLTDLSGSLASVAQALNATGGTNPQYQPGLYKYRKWQRPELVSSSRTIGK
ncbi:MAG: hypothetical protein JNK87_20550 [Bryobacterales bacterium]|nr:hypothetical protein [Bryobacterales bacterium]